MKDTPGDNPGVIAPPPLIYAVALLLSLFLQKLVPLPLFAGRIKTLLGALLVGGAGATGLFALRKMREVGTNVNPTQPTTALVTSGPYRFTRNPIYLALTLLYTGLGILFNTVWTLLLLPVVLLLMNRGVIEREEAYLEQKFGAQYQAYRENVRRWL
jgi:protein-S-isoprenylcysteine O-methyltransferase Ste14